VGRRILREPSEAELTGREGSVPTGARPVARVLLVSPEQEVLLLLAQDSAASHRWWVTPGGGVEAGESFEEAAGRELYEDTGVVAPIGPWVWTRRHAYPFDGRSFDQYERFFVALAETREVRPVRPDSYVRRHRWWTLPELRSASDDFAPRRLPELFGAIARGEYPRVPFDCGV
jgi:ADP-ribose pyrophosphatase YjhB (NUDIX family)